MPGGRRPRLAGRPSWWRSGLGRAGRNQDSADGRRPGLSGRAETRTRRAAEQVETRTRRTGRDQDSANGRKPGLSPGLAGRLEIRTHWTRAEAGTGTHMARTGGRPEARCQCGPEESGLGCQDLRQGCCCGLPNPDRVHVLSAYGKSKILE